MREIHMVTNEEILQKSKELNNLDLNKWLNQELFSLQWFLIVILVLVCYVLFFYFVDKQRLIEILLFGSFVSVLFIVYHSIGDYFGYWASYITLSPVKPDFFGDVFTDVPLITMLIYQFSSSWKKFLLIYMGFSVLLIFGYYNYVLVNINAFAYLKPSATTLDFISMLLIGIVPRGIMVYLFKIEARNGNRNAEHSLSNLIAEPITNREK